MRRLFVCLFVTSLLLGFGCPERGVDPGDDCSTTLYIDYDGDGFGSDAYTVVDCTDPEGWVDGTGDCDDTLATVHPDGLEICDRLDNDCDGLVDGEDPDLTGLLDYYLDSDGDGYGDAASSVQGCEPPPGYVTDNTDCDDSDPSVHPGADEDWFDGVDSDCEGADAPDACDEVPPEARVPIDGACTYTPPIGEFDPVVEWSMPAFLEYQEYTKSYTTPVVGNLTDDNGNGRLEKGDTPDIVVVQTTVTQPLPGVIRLISGDGSAVHWSVHGAMFDGLEYHPHRHAQVALGDIDEDGVPEIVTTVRRGSSCHPAAYDTGGALEWVSPVVLPGCRSHAPALADLDGDGAVEVLFGRVILHGADGSLRGEGSGGWAFWGAYSLSGYGSYGVDMDGDGVQEVLSGNTLYDADGGTVCATGGDDGYTAAADLDGDGLGEFVVSGNGWVRTYEHDCSPIDGWAVTGGGWGGPPTVADFDGDGAPEIGVAAKYAYSVYEVDGTELWSNPTVDASSNSTGSSVFDFDGDGRAEVVYADETTLWVYDGATGDVLLADTSHNSLTINEYPTIADVDGDGKAEIVVVHSNTSGNGLSVLGDAADNWVTARTVWNQPAYSITNVEDDLSIPASPTPNWPTWNTFRQGGTGTLNPQIASNLVPHLWGPCQTMCGEPVSVWLQVENRGPLLAPGSVDVVVYSEDVEGVRTELDRRPWGSSLEPGTVSFAWLVTVEAAQLTGAVRLVAVVDAAGAVNECEEEDNTALVPLDDICL